MDAKRHYEMTASVALMGVMMGALMRDFPDVELSEMSRRIIKMTEEQIAENKVNSVQPTMFVLYGSDPEDRKMQLIILDGFDIERRQEIMRKVGGSVLTMLEEPPLAAWFVSEVWVRVSPESEDRREAVCVVGSAPDGRSRVGLIDTARDENDFFTIAGEPIYMGFSGTPKDVAHAAILDYLWSGYMSTVTGIDLAVDEETD